MNVRLNETGQHDAVSRIYRIVGVGSNPLADLRDAPSANQQITLRNGTFSIHRHDRAVPD